jgi:hypothetical protein
VAGAHAILSPSGFKALMLCPAKPAMERGLSDSSSEYADEGTAAHFLASWCLENDERAADRLGNFIGVDAEGACWSDVGASSKAHLFEVTVEMAEAVQVYINTVKDYQGNGELFVEQALPIGHITGEEGAEGTGDAVILRDDEIIVIDLKYGRGVEVSSDGNPQLMLYGLGALERFDLVGDVKRVRMVISQPRVSAAPREFVMETAALVEWGLKYATPAGDLAGQIYKRAADGCSPIAHATPHPDACRFCKAKGTCPALAASVEGAMAAEFTDLTTRDATEQEAIVKRLVASVAPDNLGAKMDAVELVEMWCKAIRARVEGELIAGRQVAGYKLVPGRKGARAWTDAAEAEKALKAFRLKKEQMYDMSVISPTTAEKLLKSAPKRWAKVLPLIKQGEGKPSVAPLSDARPALEVKPLESEFEAIAETAEDLV